MYKAVVFDFDGVIVNSAGFRDEAYLKLFSSLGIDMSAERLHAKTGLTTRETISRIVDGRIKKRTKPNINELCRRFYYELYNVYEKKSESPPSLADFIQYCEGRKWQIGIASSTPSNIIRMVLKKFRVLKHFRTIVGGEKVVADKPDPEMLIKVLEKMGARPEDSIAIAASLHGIIAAKLAGMYAIAYLKYSQTAIHEADLSVQDFKDIMGL